MAQVRTVVAVNHGNGDQGAESLKQNPHPFNRADGGFADNDALASRIQRGMERFHYLRLCGSLLSSAAFKVSVSCSSSTRAYLAPNVGF